MIISKIIGGLGNQLFQYAAGRSLALHHNTGLRLDTEDFDEYKLRNFDLNAFHTEFEPASSEEVKKRHHRNFLKKINDRIGPYSTRNYFREKFFHFHKDFFKYPDNTYLKGYWQSEKYFQPYKNIIQSELQIKNEFVQSIKPFSAELLKKQTVSLHIRRGDFTNAAANNMHGVLSLEYYKNALSLINSKISDYQLYIFSDDIAWVKENLRQENAVYVSGELTKTHFEDLYLMSQCRHNIIANSSFSWWGAWLNNNPDKMVIAPKNWFNKGPKDTYDLFPEGWIKI